MSDTPEMPADDVEAIINATGRYDEDLCPDASTDPIQLVVAEKLMQITFETSMESFKRQHDLESERLTRAHAELLTSCASLI